MCPNRPNLFPVNFRVREAAAALSVIKGLKIAETLFGKTPHPLFDKERRAGIVQINVQFILRLWIMTEMAAENVIMIEFNIRLKRFRREKEWLIAFSLQTTNRT